MVLIGDRRYEHADFTELPDGDPQGPKYVLGLDLGKSQDYTALCVLEVHGESPEATYHCRHLQRFKLGTSYPNIVASVRELCRREPLLSNKPQLGIDQTGVGSAVADIFKQPEINAYLKPILIHGGDQVAHEGGIWRIPKRELVGPSRTANGTPEGCGWPSGGFSTHNRAAKLSGFNLGVRL